MGHERVGKLPKSKIWTDVVREIAEPASSEIDVSKVVAKTIHNVRSRFSRINEDDGVLSAFKFLVALGVACQSNTPASRLADAGIQAPETPSPLALARTLHRWLSVRFSFPEYREIAEKSAIDALSAWWRENRSPQESLPDTILDPYDDWRALSTGRGFSELSRLYFAKFTEHYLNYFLDREASGAVASISDRDALRESIRDKVDLVTRHSFETAKITQSFAAGWFNKHAKEVIPNDEEISSFLSLAFGKIREELLREEGE